MIDFTMTGINICLLIGIVLLLQGVCFLFMQNPFKNIKKFGVRDYIILVLILCFMVVGVLLTIFGIINAVGVAS